MIAAEELSPQQLFLPELMMQRGELAHARRLLRKLSRIDERSRLDEVLPKASQKDPMFFSKLRKPIWSDMDRLAANVWEREVGLERYSVVRVRRDDLDYRMQVLSFSFADGRPWQERWLWHLMGRALRKDGTLGSRNAHIGFRIADLERRHLDGVWRPLHWWEEATG